MSFAKISKRNQRPHRERVQPEARAHLGILEKKNDYKARANDFNKKARHIKALKRKALEKNPDEFSFKMVRSKTKDGVHQDVANALPSYTEDQLHSINSRDLTYISHKHSLEKKKIEKLKQALLVVDAGGEVAHRTVFVDSLDGIGKLDVTKTQATIGNSSANTDPGKVDQDANLQNTKEKKRLFRELDRRIQREQQLRVTEDKLRSKYNLKMNDGTARRCVREESSTQAPIFQFKYKRHK